MVGGDARVMRMRSLAFRLKFACNIVCSCARRRLGMQLLLTFKPALLSLLLLGATVRNGKAKQAAYDVDDDDFAEFDFDLEEEGTESELILFSAPSRIAGLHTVMYFSRI